jgi:hypothetical protein
MIKAKFKDYVFAMADLEKRGDGINVIGVRIK